MISTTLAMLHWPLRSMGVQYIQQKVPTNVLSHKSYIMLQNPIMILTGHISRLIYLWHTILTFWLICFWHAIYYGSFFSIIQVFVILLKIKAFHFKYKPQYSLQKLKIKSTLQALIAYILCVTFKIPWPDQNIKSNQIKSFCVQISD